MSNGHVNTHNKMTMHAMMVSHYMLPQTLNFSLPGERACLQEILHEAAAAEQLAATDATTLGLY
jgi:hypothetical protein